MCKASSGLFEREREYIGLKAKRGLRAGKLGTSNCTLSSRGGTTKDLAFLASTK